MYLTWTELSAALRQQEAFSRGYSPLYTALFGWLAEQSEAQTPFFAQTLLSAWGARPLAGGLEASLLLAAAVHAAVLYDDPAAAALRPFYATTGGAFDPAQDEAALGAGLEALFRQGGEALPWFLREAYIQTNEISRSLAWLSTAYLLQAWYPQASLSLIELGCSAGLNLTADQQNWAWRTARGDYRLGGGTPLMTQNLHFEEESDPAFFSAYPEPTLPPLSLVQRIGIERHLLFLDEADDWLTLQACIWGDQPERLARLEAAKNAALKHMDDVRLLEGDIMEAASLLPQLIGQPSAPHIVLVYNSAVTAYFSDADYQALRDALMHAFQALPKGVKALWLENESPRFNESVERPQHFLLRARLPFMGGVSSFFLGELEAHPHNLYLRRGWAAYLQHMLAG
jgi:hypothetical protein